MSRSLVVAVAVAGGLALVAAPARASGFLVPQFGGARGDVTADNPTAMYYNPAGLSLTRGTHLYIDGAFIWRTASYDRPASAIDNILAGGMSGSGTPAEAISANSGSATLTNFLVAPFLGLVSDFGTKSFAAGLSFYVPFGGQATWNPNNAYQGSAKYPGAVDGVQRWAAMDGLIRATYATAAASYRIEKIHLSLGVSVNLVVSQISTIRARTATGTDDLVDSSGAVREGRSFLDASGVTASLGVGLNWQPIETLWVALSYQSQPGFGETTMTGTLQNKFGGGAAQTQRVEVKQALPDALRLGARFRPTPRLELRLSGEYVRWSVFQRQCILDQSNPNRNCKLLADGSVDTAGGGAGVILALGRDWKDAFGIHAGGSFFITPTAEIFLNAAFDGNAVPAQTLEPALMDANKLLFTLGGRVEIYRRKLALSLGYTQVVYFDRTTVARKDGGPTTPLAPSRSPDTAGKYSQAVGLVALSLDYRF